jgi:hypothetical protein
VKPGSRRAAVYDALKDYGPMTMAEVCDVTGLDKYNAAAILQGLNNASARKPKRIYIVKYVFDHEGARRYPRAVYDIGDHEDARKPKADTEATRRRYRAAKKARLKANFVFNLAQSVRV